LFFAVFRRREDFLARHAEFAVVLTGLRVGVVGVDGNAGQEAQPDLSL
jgi:hypothetical protein